MSLTHFQQVQTCKCTVKHANWEPVYGQNGEELETYQWCLLSVLKDGNIEVKKSEVCDLGLCVSLQ